MDFHLDVTILPNLNFGDAELKFAILFRMNVFNS